MKQKVRVMLKQPLIFRKPDLVLALNCGFIFYKEWDRSLPSLIKYPNVPLIFTEYYEEDCKLDLQKLDSQVNNFVNPAKFSIE